MKRKVAFWIIVILVNIAIIFISVNKYRDLEARITGVETQQKKHNDKFGELILAHEKTVTELTEILGVDGEYDFNNNLVKIRDLNKFFEYKVYIKTSVLLEIPEELRNPGSDSAKSIVKTSKSPVAVIGRYVLTASHVSDAEILNKQTIMMKTPFGVLENIFEFKVLKHEVALLLADGSEYPLRELYRNKEKDFSLFEMPKNIKAPNFPFEIGKSNELKIGNFIYLNGKPAIESEVARPGFVTSLVKSLPDEVLGVKKNNDEFGLSQSTDLGDSGSSIVAFRDGQPELAGIYLGWVGINSDNGKNTRSRALKINTAVDEIKEKLGIDLREIQHRILSP